ncbi:unnamed protein product [Mytilus edulis]|uniref:DUF5641 domain-containing protein n=1 Tax=Mytilus edulis TaxID=6550 RepID=A0A8S3U374_MYTED|nr:unnamed protein product [Mytilus edulis]
MSASEWTSDKSLRRQRNLTEKAQKAYQVIVQKYWTTLTEVKQDIYLLIQAIRERTCTVSDVDTHVRQKLELYRRNSEGFHRYLSSIRTRFSDIEMENNDQELKNIEKEVQFYLNRVDEHQGTSKQDSMSEQNITVIQKEQDSEDLLTAVQLKSELKSEPPMKITLKSKAKSIRSKLSGKSKISDKSNVNSLYIKQKLKVEELRVRVEYAQQEAELLKQKANVEASIKVLNTQREFAESQKVFEVLDDCMESSEEEFEDKHLSETREKRVRQFVLDQNKILDPISNGDILVPKTDFVEKTDTKPKQNIYYDNNNQDNDLSPVTQITTQPDPKVVQTLDTKSCTLNAKAPPYYPTTINNSSEELAKFIVKKDLLISRIQKFDDKAEYFGSWKKSFCDTVKELSLSASEEVDLLVKYLGPESTKSAVSIRSANYLDLSKARDRIWERLHDRYARPEMVETSIKQKLMYFPKITYKDPKQLYDLLDIVSEIAAIKTYEQYRPLFSYFDSSAGVNPIVAKLPYQLQEKWSTEANKYKEYHSSSYPPFEVFEIFLRKIARMKNDPSFIYEDTGINSAKVHNMTKPKQRQQQNVSVLKTDLPVTKNQQYTRNTSDTVCPLHNTNHTLNKCRQFRLKPIRERQDFLKSKGLCYRCCGQKGHLARDCTAAVTCEVCKSTTHPTALHIEKFTHQQPTTKFQEQKTEPKLEQDTQKVVTACTQICKNQGTRSESKFDHKESFSMIAPDDDKEVRPLLVTCKTNSSDKEVTSDTEFVKIFESFSSWSRLVKTIARLKHIVKSFSQPNGQCKGWHMCALSSDDLRDAEKFILKEAQLEYFSKEINSLKEGRNVSSGSSIISLSPLLDENGILCVGGRLNEGSLPETLPELDTKQLYKSQWKHVVVLSQEFWKKWREQYLSNLQQRRKWNTSSDDIKEGDIVLLKDRELNRTCWPMAIVERTFPSSDDHVRKVQIRVAKDRRCYVRPICELIRLLSE